MKKIYKKNYRLDTYSSKACKVHSKPFIQFKENNNIFFV